MASHSTTTSNASGFSAISATHPPGGGPFLNQISQHPTRRGTIFIFRIKFLSYRGRGSPAGQRMNDFCPENFLCPTMCLSDPARVLLHSHSSDGSVQKRMSTYDKADGEFA